VLRERKTKADREAVSDRVAVAVAVLAPMASQG